MASSDQQHLTTQQLADRLQVERRTLEDWRRHRTGPPFIRVGQQVRYRLADIEAWEQQQTSQPHVAVRS